jgi:DNA-binding NarL/FixJ family response regulator
MRVPSQQIKDVMSEDEVGPKLNSVESTSAQSPLIVIIDVHLLSRECLARVLNHERGVAVDCYSTLDEWMAVGQRMQPSLVVLCQTGRSKADALKEVERLSQLSPQIGDCPAVILSDNEDPDIIVQMLGRNVRGYVPTSLSINVALHAIDLARVGGVFVPASSLVAAHRAPETATIAPKANGLFTARQAAVVEALRRGKANKIIAYELKMRESTVKVHVRNIMKKLHATNRTEVAFMAHRLLNGEELAG